MPLVYVNVNMKTGETANNLCFIYYRRVRCDRGSEMPPVYINVNMKTGETANNL